MLASASFAQLGESTGFIVTKYGVFVVSNDPGNYFTIEIRGKKVQAIPDHKFWFDVDGKFFQIVTPERKAFLNATGTTNLDDRGILTAHEKWESDYIAETLGQKLKVESSWTKLANGTQAMAWSFDMPHVDERQTAKRQLYLSVVKRDHVIALNTVVEGNDDEKVLWKLLTDTMNTLRPRDKPLGLDKAREQVLKEN